MWPLLWFLGGYTIRDIVPFTLHSAKRSQKDQMSAKTILNPDYVQTLSQELMTISQNRPNALIKKMPTAPLPFY